MSFPADVPAGGALGVLSRFRVEFYECPYARADALFELTDAVLCTDGPVRTLVELTLTAEHRPLEEARQPQQFRLPCPLPFPRPPSW